jgi:hypothetical protein
MLQSNTLIALISWSTPPGNEHIRRIIGSYLINIRKLAYDDAFNVTKDWLNNCYKIIRLKDALKTAPRVGYLPMAHKDFKSENMELCRHISNRLGNASSVKLSDNRQIVDEFIMISVSSTNYMVFIMM